MRSSRTYACRVPFIALLGLVILCGCRKEPEVVPDNQVPYYDGVPSVIVRNYVNRLFIDLIGREPLDTEMEAEVAFLRSDDLSPTVRTALVDRLMNDPSWVDGDSSYTHAYHRRQSDMFRARLLEGASDDVVEGYLAQALQSALADSLAGNASGAAGANLEAERLRDVLRIPVQYRIGEIGIGEVHRRLVLNGVYDFIHMNTFNYINATFDNLFFRYPTNAEFNIGYAMVENDAPGVLFGQGGQNKGEYAAIVTGNPEFLEGMVRWCYQTLLGRAPGSEEVFSAMGTFQNDHDLKAVQRRILISAEYAGFDQ